jgi:hypothetical protein
LAGCAAETEPDTGVLVVPFTLGNQRTCEDLGIVAVRAELNGGDFVEEIDCDVGQVRFNSLKPGRYTVELYGLNEDDVAAMDSLASGAAKIHVVGNGTTVVYDPALALTSAPAHLRMRWGFGFGSCDSAGIEGFTIAAWRADGSALLMESDLACGTPGDGRGQYREVPDIDRELSGDEVGEVSVQPYDQDGIAIGDPITFIFESPGAGGEIDLSLECSDSGCKGTGEPD